MKERKKMAHAERGIPADHCILCGAKPAVIGICVPEKPETWGALEGKARLFRYCLCQDCNEKPDKAELVEKIIRSELSGGGLTHAE